MTSSFSTRFLRSLRRFFAGSQNYSQNNLFTRHTVSFFQIQWIVRGFYCFLFFIALQFIDDWDKYASRTDMIPLWPLMWMEALPLEGPGFTRSQGILSIMALFTFGSLSAAILPRFCLCRIAAFLGIFFFTAFNNSFGKIGHSLHLLVFISFIWIFLPSQMFAPFRSFSSFSPDTSPSRSIKQKSLLVFWTGQAVIMLSYSMAGLIKILAGIYQLFKGEPSIFGAEALARHTAHRLFESGTTSYLGELIISNLWLSFFMMWFAIYIELFALWALFRPRILWFFAASLILFHMGSEWIMTIIFPQACFLLALVIVASPIHFISEKDRPLLAFLQELPLIGFCLTRIMR